MKLNIANAMNQLPDSTRFLLAYLCFECYKQRKDRLDFYPYGLALALRLNQRGIDRALHRLAKIGAIARNEKGEIIVR